jgi:glutaredoxin
MATSANQGSEKEIKVYGADWCGYTQRTLRHLDQTGLAYQYINVEDDEKASEWVKAQNDGMEIKPTLDIEGEILTAPPNDILDNSLRQHGLL